MVEWKKDPKHLDTVNAFDGKALMGSVLRRGPRNYEVYDHAYGYLRAHITYRAAAVEVAQAWLRTKNAKA